MPGAERAEIYFIAAMMLLTLILSFAAVYIFVKQYKKEKKEKQIRDKKKESEKSKQETDGQ